MGNVNGNILGERKEKSKKRLSHTIIDVSMKIYQYLSLTKGLND